MGHRQSDTSPMPLTPAPAPPQKIRRTHGPQAECAVRHPSPPRQSAHLPHPASAPVSASFAISVSTGIRRTPVSFATASTTCSFSSGSSEQVEYTSRPPTSSRAIAPRRIALCRAACRARSSTRSRCRISGLRASVPVRCTAHRTESDRTLHRARLPRLQPKHPPQRTARARHTHNAAAAPPLTPAASRLRPSPESPRRRCPASRVPGELARWGEHLGSPASLLAGVSISDPRRACSLG